MGNEYLNNFKTQNPEYKDIPDDKLADALYKTFYKEHGIEEQGFYDSIEMKSPSQIFQEKSIASYKDTSPDSWTDKIAKDLGFGSDSKKEDVADIASKLNVNENNQPITPIDNLLPNGNIETPILKLGKEKVINEQEPTTDFGKNIKQIKDDVVPLINRVESSLKQFSNKTARGLQGALNHILNNITNPEINGDKLSKEEIVEFAKAKEITLDQKILDKLDNETKEEEFKEFIKPIKKIEQTEADFTSGFTKEQRDVVNQNMKTIHDAVNDGELFTAFTHAVKEIPGILADSSGEIVQLITLPTSALAINARVMDFEEEYIKNNGGKKPDAAWYTQAYISQTALLLAERFGIHKAGQIALSKAPKGMKIPMILAGGGAFESGQEWGEEISEEYLTQKEGEKTLTEIAKSPEAKTSAFLGGVTGIGLAGAGTVTSHVNSAINGKSDEELKQEVEEELIKTLNNTEVNTNQAYYQQQNDNIETIDTPVINKQLEDATQGFAKLQEDIKTNNDKPIEELLQKDLEVKVSDEPTPNPILDNNISTNQEVQNQDSALPVPAVESNNVDTNNTNGNEILKNALEKAKEEKIINSEEYQNIANELLENETNKTPQIDEKQIESTFNDIGQKVTYSTNKNNAKIVNTEIYEGLNQENQFNESGNGVFHKSKTIKDGELKSQTDYILNNDGDFVDASEINILSNQSNTTPFIGTKEQRKQIIDLMVEKETATGERVNEINEQVQNIVLNTNKSSQGDESITEKNKIDETQWHSIPDDMDVKISQGSNRANELTIKDLNKNNDPYIYQTAEVQGEQGVSNIINRRLATNEELAQKSKNRLIDIKFQNYFDNGKIDEDGFMTTKSMSKEQFKEFNDYIKENNIGSYINKKYSKGGKTGFKIDNQDVINTWFKKDENSYPTPEIDSVVKENLISENIANNESVQNNPLEKIGSFEINPITRDATFKRLMEHNKKLGFKGVALRQESEAVLDKINFDDVTGLATGLKKINNTGENTNARSENQVENAIPQTDENSISEDRQNQLNELIRFNSLGVDREIKNDYDRELQKINQSRLDYIKSDDFKKIITDLDSEQEVMFKRAGKKVATRGKLFDLPFGLKGVVVYGNKNDGKIFEYSSGSYLNSWGHSSSNKADLETIIHIRDNLINRGEDNIKSIMDNAGDKILNPQVVMAKPIPKVGDIKKGQVEFELLLGDDTIEKSFGYPVKLPYNIDGFAHKVKDGWKITEKRSGLQVGFSSTKEKAIQEAKEAIGKHADKINSIIERAERNKFIIENIEKATKEFDSLNEVEKKQLLKDMFVYKTDEQIDKILSNKLNNNTQKAISERYVDNNFNLKPREEIKENATIQNEQKKEVENESTNERATEPDTTSNEKNSEPRISTKEPRASDTIRDESSKGELQDRHSTDDTSNNVSSTVNELPNTDERMGGYRTNEHNKQDNIERTNDNAVLPESTNTNPTKLNYDLRTKEPIALTRGQRKAANAQVQEIIKKPLEDITEADKDILRLHTGDGGLDTVTEGSFNQHFTNYKTISSIYEALENSGFKYEKVLEPAVGSGNFIGFAPDKTWDVVDIDQTNIEVVKRLYPQVKRIHNETFETFTGKNYDLVISNVPFASVQALTREHIMKIKPQFKAIHNFYFAHALEKVKDNGMLVFMTSTSTLDGTTEAKKLREHIISQADVLGTFRLPENSQRENAHTDTMIDIIFLQKRPDGVKSRQEEINQKFVNIIEYDGYPINNHLISQKGILGKLEIGSDRTKMGKIGLIATGEPDYSKIQIDYEPYEVVKKDKEKATFKTFEEFDKYAKDNNVLYSWTNKVKDLVIDEKNNVIIYDEQVTFSDDSNVIVTGAIANSKTVNKIKSLNSIMKFAEEYQQSKNEQAKINALNEIASYKEIYKKAPHSDASLKKYMKDHNADKLYKEFVSYFDKDFKPAAIFKEEVRFEDSGNVEATKDSSLQDRALSYEDSDGVFDTKQYHPLVSDAEISSLLAKNEYAIIADGKIQNAYMYYAGNIYEKIDNLESIYEANEISKEQYERQMKKLEEIKPPATLFQDMRFKGTESWFPKTVSEKFITQRDDEFKAKPDIFSNNSYYEIFANYLNGKQLVSQSKDETSDEHRQKLLEANKVLHEEILPEVKSLIEQNGDTDIVETAYNKSSSFYVAPNLTGQLLRDMPKHFRGKPFNMQSHQKEGAELVVYNKKGVIAFAPGGGKTITAIVAVKQLLNQGVMKKPLFVVPVNTIAQWEETVRELYPEAKVFEFPKLKSGANKGQAKEWSQLTKDEKEQIVYDLSNNRYDFTIIGDTAFTKIGLPSHIIEQYAQDLVNETTQIDEEADSKKTKKGVISAEAKKKAFVRGIVDQYSGDVTIDIEKLGFDAIIADEVQNYKNIGMQGKDVRGNLGASVSISYYKNGELLTQKDISDGVEPDQAKLGSWRAYDFRFKTRYISEKNNGNNIILLTGTPTPNKPLELMTLLHHLDVNILKEYNIDSVGDFTSTFFETSDFETTDGQGKPKTEQGLSSIRNTQWLKKIIKRFVNYKGFEDMPDLPRPKQVDVEHYLSLSPAGEVIFTDIKDRLVKAIEDSKDRSKSKEDVEQTITMYMAGRDASIDLRLYNVGIKGKSAYTQAEINELIEQDSSTTLNNKVDKTVDLVVEQFKKDRNSGQIIFNDRIKYKDKDGVEKSVHQEIKNKLLESGEFKANEVVIVTGQQYTNPDTGVDLKLGSIIKNSMLQKIMDKYNAGEIKVIIGNTAKLGVGVDLNRYTTDIYQIDIPFRPDHIEQRNNRGVRQGNINKEVRVHSFFQLGTFDSFSYDLIKKKEGFNNIFWKDTQDEYSEIDKGEQLDPYEMVIQVEPDPFKREKLRLEKILDRGQFELKDIEKKQRRYEAEILAKDSLINGEFGFKNRIAKWEDELIPKNYPKYESIKDADAKAIKIEEHIKRTNDKISKDKSRIVETNQEISNLKGLVEKTKKDYADKLAQIQMVTETFVFNERVSLDLIKEHYTEEQLLSKEGKTTSPSKESSSSETLSMKNTSKSETKKSSSTKKIKTNDEVESDILYSQGFDEVGSNYISAMRTKGFPGRPNNNNITISNRTIDLPSFDKPQTVETVREFLKDIIGNRLYDGRVKGKSKLGFYNKANTGMRVKDYHDIETQAHEMAHYLDYFYKNSDKTASTSFFKDFKNKHKEFLKSVSYTQSKELAIPEGFAEFIRLYTTNFNDLESIVGSLEVIEDFEKTLAKDSVLQKKLHKYQEEAHKYIYQGHLERNIAASDSTLSKEASKLSKSKEEKLTKWKQEMVDKNLSIKNIEEFLKGKDPIDTDESAYKLFNLVNGHGGTVDMALGYGIPFVDSNGDVQLDESKKGLDEIFKPLFKAGHKEIKLWEAYAKAKRAEELLSQGREKRIDAQAIEAGLKLEEVYPHFKTIFNEYQEFNDSMLDFYVGMKLITKEQKKSFQEANNNYVPFHRVRESIAQGKIVNSSSGKLGKRLTGGTETINNIMDNIYSGVEKNIRDAYVARAKSSLYEMLSSANGAEFAMKIDKESKLIKSDLDTQANNIANVLFELGLAVTQDGMIIQKDDSLYSDVIIEKEDIANILRDNPDLLENWSVGHIPTSSTKMIDSAIIDGKRTYFEINDEMLIDTLIHQKGLMIESRILKTALMWKNATTFMITNNPLFYLRNAFRDTVSASMMSDNGFIPFLDTLRGMVHFIKRDKMYKDFMVSGAGYSTRRTALGSYDDINFNNSKVKRHFGAFHKAVEALSYGADLFEYGTRLGEFAKAKKKGKSNMHSAYSAREVSTDFSRSGSNERVRAFLGTVAFAKAGINSIDRVYRRFSDTKTTKDKITLTIAGASIAAFSILLSMMNEDDDRYNQLTKDQKSMFWWIYLDKIFPKETLDKLGINPVWKLPKPYDVGIVFGNIPEMIFEYMNGMSDTKELKDRFLFDLFRSGGVLDYPSSIKGTVEIMANKDWQGRPIEGLGMQYIPKSKRATQNTPEIYKLLGNDMVSPVQLHHLSNSILGLYGRMIDDALEATLWNKEKKGERAFATYNPLDYLTKPIQGREVESRTKYSDRFYDYLKEITEADGDFKKSIKEKDKNSYDKIRADKKKIALIQMKKNADKVSKSLSEINKRIEAVKTNKTLTAIEKEDTINNLLKRKQQLVQKAVMNIEQNLKGK